MAIGPHQFVTELAKQLSAKGIAPALPDKNADTPANIIAGAPDLPDLVTFAGYLGGKVPHAGRDWRLLYCDSRLQTWLLVEESNIVYNATLDDYTSPFRKRDVIWVKESASVGTGRGSQSAHARFLTGAFTRAGDFDAPLGGGTLAAATGVFCEAKTAACCHRKSY
jgi:hypothetical protein